MKFAVDKQIFEKFPDLHVGIVVAKNIDNTGSDEKIYHLLEEVTNLLKSVMTADTIKSHPLIVPWKTAFSEFGAKPKKHHSSVEALTTRVLSGDTMPKINKLVDLYNYLSLKHIVPVGGDDLDKIDGDIKLTIAKGDEPFLELNTKEKKEAKQGEVIYRDSKEVLCRRWNWRECEKTKMTEQSKNVVLFIEGLPPVLKGKVDEVTKELADLITTFLKGKCSTFIVDKDNQEIEF